jgi:hypothetical protein
VLAVLAADFRKDAWRMYTSVAANFFEGLNYAFIEASVLQPFEALCTTRFCMAGGLLLGCLCAIIRHDRKLLHLARGGRSTAPIQFCMCLEPHKVHVLLS